MDAVLTGLIGAVIGAVLTGVVRLLVDLKLRYERQTELMIALHAEIVASLTKVREQNTDEELDYAANDQSPFAMADDTDFVFNAVKADPAILPKDIIYPIIRYYKLAGQSNGLVRGLAEDAFTRFQPIRAKQKYARQITELTREQEIAGLLALEALEKSAETRGETGLACKRLEAEIRLAREIKSAVLLDQS